MKRKRKSVNSYRDLEVWQRGIDFLRIARSSLLEVETQIIIAHRLGYLNRENLEAALQETEAESRMLLSLIRSLEK